MRVGPLVIGIRTIATHRRRTCSLYHSELTRAFARVDDQMKSHFAARHGRFWPTFPVRGVAHVRQPSGVDLPLWADVRRDAEL